MLQDRQADLLSAIFIASLISAHLLGVKIASIFGFAVSVGTFLYPLTFLVSNIFNEVYGKEKAKCLVQNGLIALVIVFLFAWFGIALKADPRYTLDQAYDLIFEGSLRLIIATLIAYFASQYYGAWSFQFLKKKTAEKHLWLRNNASTIISQLIDTTIFMFIAFYHYVPQYDSWLMIKLIFSTWLIKIILTIIGTPLCYWGVGWLKKVKN